LHQRTPVRIESARAELREQLRTLGGILLVGTLVLIALVLVSALTNDLQNGLLIYGSGVVLHVLHWQWLRWRPTRTVAVSHCLLYFVWVTLILALRAGGMTAPAAFVYPPLVLMAGLVWSGRAALGMAILTSASGAALLWSEHRGWLPPSAAGQTPFQLWLVMTACVMITASLIRFALGTIARSNEERLDNERRFADLVRAAPDAMLFVDRQGLVRGANPALRERFGHSPEAIAGQSLDSLGLFEAHALCGLRAQIAATLADGSPRTAEWPARYNDGSSHPVEAHSYRVDDAGHESRVCVSIRDLGEREQRRKLEERLREGQRLEALGRLAGGVAHDFNNLLTVILSSADLIAMSGGRPSEELTAISDSAKRAALLTRQLLAFGRRQVLLAESVDLSAAIEQALPLLKRLLHAEIKLEFTASANRCYAAVDRSQLDQILINLVVNARDAMPRGGTVTIECSRSEASTAQPASHGWVWFRVSDTGVGIPPELQSRIFEPFFTTKRGERGSGLGLSTVHGIVTQSGGSVRIESAPDAGSSFHVTLPGAAAPRAPVDRGARPAETKVSIARVLVVDDDAPVRTVLRAILESGGHEVTAVDSAADALRAIDRESGRFDLLLTDVVMSGMSGPALAASARQRQPGLRVLYTSGHAEEMLDARGVLSSAQHFIAKPFVARELLLRVEQILTDAPTPSAPALADPESRA
jgi:two-component system, cell cycle sensor histidine kinase and response regulator CckA